MMIYIKSHETYVYPMSSLINLKKNLMLVLVPNAGIPKECYKISALPPPPCFYLCQFSNSGNPWNPQYMDSGPIFHEVFPKTCLHHMLHSLAQHVSWERLVSSCFIRCMISLYIRREASKPQMKSACAHSGMFLWQMRLFISESSIFMSFVFESQS